MFFLPLKANFKIIGLFGNAVYWVEKDEVNAFGIGRAVG
jgi:hypothetical protein